MLSLNTILIELILHRIEGVEGRKIASEWKKLSSNELGITNSMISKPTRVVLKEKVTTTFSWCEIVGRRFPICHVHVGDDIVEVSSFSTSARNQSMAFEQRHDGCEEKDYIRWKNCMQRDLTINGFFAFALGT